MNLDPSLVTYILSGSSVVLWYLLRQKDATQAAQIALLFTKHDDDAKALQDLRLEIARHHYEKEELDARFGKLEETVRLGFLGMRDEFSKLSTALLDHMGQEHKR